ncbi:pyridoxamine 5'-phosphate oxidase family protein [Methyloversatilis thermotolerans]|uniref:pyridoxamine 5'-phosphate oxidase family protein n=1 Tax=Methyloversatilis thermotolerans TaxID=1346290 RepID=UPI000371E5CE|nr:pyridoxamine 5'-phosphate oxidase family protein [Methyloversatilis thermotolerans]
MTPEQTRTLRQLLADQPCAALATLHKGDPAVSMVPFALRPDGRGFIIHVSGLATHTADMLAHPAVGVMVTAPLIAGTSPLALARLSVRGQAARCAPDSAGYAALRAAYVARLPDSEELFSFGDFSLFLITVESARFVAGFAQALSLTATQFATATAG